MDGRVKEVNRIVRGYDSQLFAQRERNGAIHVYRRTRNSADPFHPVFCLTDNWNATGKPREWGLEVIRERLRAMDLWKNETVVDELEKDAEKSAQSAERDLKNNVESFLKEFRRQFARATDGINTGTLDKRVDLRRKYGA